jgi:hypothetical protein
MNVNRVGMTSFGNLPYYNEIKSGNFTYNSLSPNVDYKLDAVYSMLAVVRDEQREQAKMLANNQTVLRDLMCDTTIDMANWNSHYDTVNKYTYEPDVKHSTIRFTIKDKTD